MVRSHPAYPTTRTPISVPIFGAGPLTSLDPSAPQGLMDDLYYVHEMSDDNGMDELRSQRARPAELVFSRRQPGARVGKQKPPRSDPRGLRRFSPKLRAFRALRVQGRSTAPLINSFGACDGAEPVHHRGDGSRGATGAEPEQRDERGEYAPGAR